MLTLWPKLIIAAAIAAALGWLYIEIRKDGAESVITKIERLNNEAGKSADDSRSAYDRCLDTGGLWDFGTGGCQRASPGDGD
jgi:hypothetical protein